MYFCSDSPYYMTMHFHQDLYTMTCHGIMSKSLINFLAYAHACILWRTKYMKGTINT